jgi:hypothetical protein
MFHTLPFVSIVVSSSGVLFAGGARVRVWRVLSLYLKVTRTKKFASKPKFRGNKYVRFNENTGVSAQGRLHVTKVAKAFV